MFFKSLRKKKMQPYAVQESVVVGGAALAVTVTFSERSTIGLVVKRSGEVWVRVPFGTQIELVRSVVTRKYDWISTKQHYFQGQCDERVPLEYKTGEKHLYLGQTYLLEVEIGSKEGVWLVDAQLVVRAKEAARVEAVLKRWYKTQAIRELTRIAQPIVADFGARRGKMPGAIKFRKMRRRWGSCSSVGGILLNTELVRAPEACIAYVVSHELCHLVHHNHSAHYYKLLEEEFPNWKVAKKRLESVVMT